MNPLDIKSDDLRELEELAANFPYFNLSHQLIAKGHKDSESSLSDEKLKVASVYAANRGKLRELILQKSKNQKETKEDKKGTPTPPPASPKMDQKKEVKSEVKSESTFSKPTSKTEPKKDSEKEKKTKLESNPSHQEKEKPSSSPSDIHIERLVIPDVLKRELDLDEKPKTTHSKPEEKKTGKEEKEETTEKETSSKEEQKARIQFKEPIKHASSEEKPTSETDKEEKKNTSEENEVDREANKEENTGKEIPKFNFKSQSAFDYFNEESNVKLENLIPEEEYKIEGAEKGKETEQLIPDFLGFSFGITESRLGESLLSNEVLEKEGIEELKLTKEKNIQEKQTQIIENFLDKLPSLKVQRTGKVPLNQPPTDNLAKKKLVMGNDVTETLAEIHLKQGNIKKAKKIFERLMLKFPDKKAYFAKKLREIS